MDILDTLFASQENSPPLEELVNAPTPSALPFAAARNRAASTALLASKPESAVEDYRLMMREHE